MTLAAYEKEVRAHRKIGENDRVWFPRWVRRYAISFPRGLTEDLPITRNGVVKFSQGLRDRGAPAWQRWQAVRAIAFYRNVVFWIGQRRTSPTSLVRWRGQDARKGILESRNRRPRKWDCKTVLDTF